jgi:hypothetical protein
LLQGYYNDGLHAGCRVEYADSAGSVAWGNVSGRPNINDVSGRTVVNTDLSKENGGGRIGFNTTDAFSAQGGTVSHYGMTYLANATAVALSGYFGLSFYTQGGHRMNIDTGGIVSIYNTGDSIRAYGDIVAYYSDERLKDRKGNIKDALAKVMSLNGFYYTPNAKAQQLGYTYKEEVGVSAQEVERVLPQIIKDAPVSSEYKTLNYGRLTPLLIEAIKEQQNKIIMLEAQIQNLLNR